MVTRPTGETGVHSSSIQSVRSCLHKSLRKANHLVTGLTPGHVFQREQAKTEKNEGKCEVRDLNPGHVIYVGRHQKFGAIRAYIHA